MATSATNVNCRNPSPRQTFEKTKTYIVRATPVASLLVLHGHTSARLSAGAADCISHPFSVDSVSKSLNAGSNLWMTDIDQAFKQTFARVIPVATFPHAPRGSKRALCGGTDIPELICLRQVPASFIDLVQEKHASMGYKRMKVESKILHHPTTLSFKQVTTATHSRHHAEASSSRIRQGRSQPPGRAHQASRWRHQRGLQSRQ